MRDAKIKITGRIFNAPTTVGKNNTMKFSVGVYKGKNKETGKGQSAFFDVVDWNSVHTFTPEPGSYVSVTGEVNIDEYTAKDGTKRTSIVITPETIAPAQSPFDNNRSSSRAAAQPVAVPQSDELCF